MKVDAQTFRLFVIFDQIRQVFYEPATDEYTFSRSLEFLIIYFI